jgi:hypothetical protein
LNVAVEEKPLSSTLLFRDYVEGAPRVFLRVESAAIALSAILAYRQLGAPWWLFAALILVPDLSMLGYLAGPRLGAFCYNVMHIYLGPLILVGIGIVTGSSLVEALGCIWVAHIGIDRLLGYGLKYPRGFAFTHLGAIGFRGRAQS